MHQSDVAHAKLKVTLTRALNDEPLPGWIAELAKIDYNDIPSCTVEEFRAALPDSVPEWAELVPFKNPPRWKFWAYW